MFKYIWVMIVVEHVEPTWVPVFEKEEARNLFPHCMWIRIPE